MAKRTVNVSVDVCHACVKEHKKTFKRMCDKCMLKMACMLRPIPICTNICNACWTPYVNVAKVLSYKGRRDDWAEDD